MHVYMHGIIVPQPIFAIGCKAVKKCRLVANIGARLRLGS